MDVTFALKVSYVLSYSGLLLHFFSCKLNMARINLKHKVTT